jgi:hypothetical protein
VENWCFWPYHASPQHRQSIYQSTSMHRVTRMSFSFVKKSGCVGELNVMSNLCYVPVVRYVHAKNKCLSYYFFIYIYKHFFVVILLQSAAALECILAPQASHSTTNRILESLDSLVTTGNACIHIKAIGFESISEQLQFSFHLPFSRDNQVMLVPYENWANPIFLQYSTSESRFVFTRYNSELSKFHCCLCQNSKHCRHFKELNKKSTAEKIALAQARNQAILHDITLRCNEGTYNIKLDVHSSVKFPDYNPKQLLVMTDRNAWIMSLLSNPRGHPPHGI